jgi:hypothetical protein
MRVIAASIFAIVWACVHAADEIASLDKFKAEYASLMRLGSTSAERANAAIMGAAEPEATTLEPLWRWYRTVDASHKALAKQVMDQAASNPLGGVLALANFKTTFDALMGTLDKGNVVDKWKVVLEILGDSRPSTPANQATWTAYQALDAASQAVAKTEIMEDPFVKLFETQWKGDISATLTYEELMAARANTMNMKTPGKLFYDNTAPTPATGLDTNKVYGAVSDGLREQMVHFMG